DLPTRQALRRLRSSGNHPKGGVIARRTTELHDRPFPRDPNYDTQRLIAEMAASNSAPSKAFSRNGASGEGEAITLASQPLANTNGTSSFTSASATRRDDPSTSL